MCTVSLLPGTFTDGGLALLRRLDCRNNKLLLMRSDLPRGGTKDGLDWFGGDGAAVVVVVVVWLSF